MLLLALSTGLTAQTTILDFETPETSTTFQYFENNELSEQLTMVIANPNASGINTSAMVTEFVKTANAATFAGAFSNPDPATAVDLSTETIICVDAHMPNEGNLRIKLENSTTGGPNWDGQQAYTTPNAWQQLCFNTALPSVSDGTSVAAGNTYTRIVVFFDFDEVLTTPETYYFDNIITKEPPVVDVTFAVDLNGYTGPDFTTAYVNGSFNSWQGTDNPLSDEDGDGIWTATYPITVGPMQYKFTLDGWTVQEDFAGKPIRDCTTTTPDGFINRFVVLEQDTILPTVCWESCYACGEAVTVSFNVGTSHITVDPGGIFIAGGGNFGVPGQYPMADPDLDGVYSIAFEKPVNFSSYYAFANGNCPDFTCKEDLTGLPCADPNNFNDRFLPPVTQDTVINTCYELCTEDLECGGEIEMVSITINVGTSTITVDPTGLFLAGGGTFGVPGENPMSDDDGDGVWSITFEKPVGFSSFWTISNGNDPGFAGKEDIAGQPCARPDNFNDRFMGPIMMDTVINTCFGQCTTTTMCEEPPMRNMVTFRVDMNRYPDPSIINSMTVAGSFQGWNNAANPMTDADGDGIWETTVELVNGEYEFKFLVNGVWGMDEMFDGGEECTKTTGDFTNRVVMIEGDTILPAYCFNECVTCDMVNTLELQAKGIEFSVRPTITHGQLLLDFGNQPLPLSQLYLVTPQGQVLQQWTLDGVYQQTINTSQWPAGMYFLTLVHDGARGVQRVIKQ